MDVMGESSVDMAHREKPTTIVHGKQIQMGDELYMLIWLKRADNKRLKDQRQAFSQTNTGGKRSKTKSDRKQ